MQGPTCQAGCAWTAWLGEGSTDRRERTTERPPHRAQPPVSATFSAAHMPAMSTITMPAPAATAPRTLEWGPLFSHYSEDTGAVPVFRNPTAASKHGKDVASAQPGIEFELMQRADGGPWRSVMGNLSIRDVIERRWPRS